MRFSRRRVGVQQAGQAAEAVEQRLRQLQHAQARQAGAQQQRQQLGVGQRAGAAGQQLFARPGVGGQVFQRQWRAACSGSGPVKSRPVYRPHGPLPPP